VLLLLHRRLRAGLGIRARRLVVGFRLVLARLLGRAALRFASREGYFAVAVGFCDGHVVGLVRGIVVEFYLLVIDLRIRFIQRALRAFFALGHLVVRLLLGLGYIFRNIFR